MSFPALYVGDYGHTIELLLGDDVSDCTSIVFRFTDPDRSDTLVTGGFSSDGVDGKVRATTPNGLLHVHGSWRICAVVTKSSLELTSRAVRFHVYERP